MVRLQVTLATLALAALGAAGPAVASPCSDGLASLSGRVKTEARESIAASTGSKTIAARREGEGETGTAPAADRRQMGSMHPCPMGRQPIALDNEEHFTCLAPCRAGLSRAVQPLARRQSLLHRVRR